MEPQFFCLKLLEGLFQFFYPIKVKGGHEFNLKFICQMKSSECNNRVGVKSWKTLKTSQRKNSLLQTKKIPTSNLVFCIENDISM